MSGSPKLSVAELEALKQKMLEEDRARQAKAEEERRKEREARERSEKLMSLRNTAHNESMRILGEVGKRSSASWAVRAAYELLELRDLIYQVQRRIQTTDDFAAFDGLNSELHAIDNRIGGIEVKAKAAENAEKLQRENKLKEAHVETELGDIAASLISTDKKFDPTGRSAIEKNMEKVRSLMNAEKYDEAASHITLLKIAVENHNDRTAIVKAEWEIARRDAFAAVSELEIKLAGLKSDEVIMDWAKESVGKLESQLAGCRSFIAAERWQDAMDQAKIAESMIPRIVEDASRRELQEQTRTYIVDGMVDVLRQQGFIVGDPVMAGGDLDSDIIIRAARPDRRSLEARIPVIGPVAYDVDGYDRVTEPAPGGATYSSCDEAESRLLEIHRQMMELYGISMGELAWEGKDPDRIRRNANELPGGGGQAQRRGR